MQLEKLKHGKAMPSITKQDPVGKTGFFLVFSLSSPALLHATQNKKTTMSIRTEKIKSYFSYVSKTWEMGKLYIKQSGNLHLRKSTSWIRHHKSKMLPFQSFSIQTHWFIVIKLNIINIINSPFGCAGKSRRTKLGFRSEENQFFESFIFLFLASFGHLLLCTILEIDSLVQKTTCHECISEEEPVITHLTASPFHTGLILKTFISLPHCKVRRPSPLKNLFSKHSCS